MNNIEILSQKIIEEVLLHFQIQSILKHEYKEDFTFFDYKTINVYSDFLHEYNLKDYNYTEQHYKAFKTTLETLAKEHKLNYTWVDGNNIKFYQK